MHDRDDAPGRPATLSLNWQMLAVLVVLACQSAAGFIWFGKLDQRVTAVEANAAPVQDTRNAVARLDERTLSMQSALARIEQRLDDKAAGQ